MVRDYSPIQSYNNLLDRVLRHRDAIISHLCWVCIFLGMHSFGLYIHNDIMQSLGRPYDMFSDDSILFSPFLVQKAYSNFSVFTTSTLLPTSSRFVCSPINLGTSDLLIHHIHAFTIHVTVLILLKALLLGRSSRLISDKHLLGNLYPCDGPGRGGTCQVSGFDHAFLGLFWMYNSISVVAFHLFWKFQSEVWAYSPGSSSNYSSTIIEHITGSDFSSNAHTINGWLRSFLWSQSSQVIQSYGTSLSGFGLLFLGCHFVWALSLMFNYSGRGYWQELIESIVWSGFKLGLFTYIQPRALSISHGRSVGMSHYICGGIGCTWSFFLARVFALAA